ncbi:hypothetical protein [Methylobacterium oxalidis]|uniref:Uncharacterized protein n=1 Tax=Methylobacterium oxalidis TaxID=944322 RepID=A0A512J0Y3_9HYPH|nr:hypothetical protein [Methylobacterium oxalidis]GEP03622.1 hypothetical protein MOX02_16600 [Methylobacterium oxalidis]GJE34329.1 hypothetical protein LDDCCGHA_4540 [Methylobacterium oxalidis]GLS64949.1 hypothetical protein GCM10007888_33300 [Methylobacterium oxalidis]
MRLALVLVGAVLLFCALFVRSYTVPPAPDRRGYTAVSLAPPNRPLFGSPRTDCLGSPDSEPVIGCLVASVNRARREAVPLLVLAFSPTCYDLSQRVALIGRDGAAAEARLAQIARFGW